MKNIFKILSLLLIVIIITSCGEKTEKEETVSEKVENVRLTVIEKGNVTRNIKLSTSLQGYETVNISPSVTGTIENIYVDVDSKVNKGDLLVRMDQTQVRNARLIASNAAVEFERVKVLHESGTISQQVYDQTKLGYEQSKENKDFLEANTYFKAPIRGVIAAKNYENGELYSGQPILILTQVDKLKAYMSIPETYIPYIKKGMKVEITTGIYSGEMFSGTIETVYPTVNPDTHTFQIKISIPNGDNKLRPGMYVDSNVILGEVEALMIPYQAVLRMTGTNVRYVFIEEDGIAKRVEVQTGQRYDEMIEIVSGNIKAGDKLVTSGQARLVDKVKLNIVK